MPKETKQIYQFGRFRLDSSERTLLRDQEPVPLTLKAFDILVVLLQNSGHVVQKDELMNAVWADTAVEESNLSQNIYTLRKALGQISEGCEFIETIPRVGYRFAAPVQTLPEDSDLVLERHTSSQIVIEEEVGLAEPASEAELKSRGLVSPQWQRRKRLWVLVAAAVLSVGITTALLVRAYLKSNDVMSVAVLPFSNATGDPGEEYFSDGVAEDVIDDLARLPDVRVMSRHASFSFKGKQDDPQQVGKLLNVAAVLTGRISRENGELVLKTELVDVSSGSELWGQRYRSGSGDVASLHSDLARDLAGRFHWGSRSAPKHFPGQEAYELYLKGKFYYSRRTPDDMKKGLAYEEQAVAKDPDFAEAYAFLAIGNILSLCMGEECYTAERNAERYAERALQLDPGQGRPHTVLAILRTFRMEWPEAEREFKRGIELSGNEGAGHAPYALFYLLPQSRYEEAIREFRRYLEGDPYEPVVNANLAYALFCAGKNDEAVEVIQKALRMNSGFPLLYRRLADIYATEHRYDDAAAAMIKGNPDLHFPSGRLDATTFWSTMLEASSGKVLPEAYAYVALGKKGDALTNLEKKFEQDQGRLAEFIRSPLLDGIRSEPRYAALMKKMDLPL
jgi:DNA-binding winged helix-turn-helix (wHTH) protein/TolB-like protein/tetratricopeptide (TPR) repeat protein